MNAVLLAVIVLFALAISRVHIVLSLILAAIVGGLVGGLGFNDTLTAFSDGLGGGASIALSYALLGAFAVGLSKTGLPDVLAERLIAMSGRDVTGKNVLFVKALLLSLLLLLAISSQNVLPIHIAFIPIVVPPLLVLFNELKLDRRLVATILTFGLVTPYMLLPVGFGGIYLNEILLPNVETNGMAVGDVNIVGIMAIPALGMVFGLIAAFIHYRKPRDYETIALGPKDYELRQLSPLKIGLTLAVVLVVLVVQLQTDSMIASAVTGLVLLSVLRLIPWSEADDIFTSGMRMMAFIGFVMIAASGFAAVIRETGAIEPLVNGASGLMGDSQFLAALVMLLVGLVITLGIGSSFSTIPIIAAIFVPLCIQYGFSVEATIAIIGTAGALGDAGSPASDSTLGPTSGLNADGQHDHLRETVWPTFLHYNIPLIVFGLIAAMVL
ncbi:MAG: TRAP transporter large permease subunit [Exiguobacterium sp.]|uniref:TRAP transporter large permease subunit n=1 Tax=Exiguobacterium alkaliphilum TaxID=1428684 RepID=A0ABT2KUH2_9BACL|nr:MULTISPECIES: Na+/H+ antiporter NhaC family protein [Exiguobacterium]MDX5322510.1 TRAP transporter large permease subunit [Exiguobacterium sp.]KDN59206.1 sodium:proton antiporter [Exiguobacterium sp. AB2]MCT4794617.1 TRAP transporter large permease subunit [Exiguobacterium alkaliphilum]MDX5424236.1 TRAP transporter large permease subunit [Exiguobacterium sp.]MDX6771755.1 TRAP transporter large permease subunit [Exiguobacterium sp.]